MAVPSESRVSWERIVVRTAGLVAALALGIYLGASSYFSPENLPTAETVPFVFEEGACGKTPFLQEGAGSTENGKDLPHCTHQASGRNHTRMSQI